MHANNSRVEKRKDLYKLGRDGFFVGGDFCTTTRLKCSSGSFCYVNAVVAFVTVDNMIEHLEYI